MSATITDPRQIHAILDRHVLADVEKPGQYVGGEVNSVRKDPGSVEVSIALCFPDLYTVGMAHLGYQILYSIINGLDWAAAERAYAPWPDMQREMRSRGIPLYALESFRPVRQFDAVGFTLQSEMLFTNILMMLELAGVPVESAERTEGDPIVIAGGPGAAAPEPLADFIDLFFIGDGESSVVQFAELLRELKAGGVPREEMILEAARRIPCVYAPALYRVEWGEGGRLGGIRPAREGLPERVRAACVGELDEAPFPDAPFVPFVEAVHERVTLEIMRGCTRGCRFCQAGMLGRPTRHRSPQRLFDLACASYDNTGYDEIALASLSSSDYPHLQELLDKLSEHFNPLRVGISLPSLRVSDQLSSLVGSLSSVRKSGLTLAPEAATERLRAVINKGVSDRELLEAAEAAVGAGWRLMKLYFMVGLPTETREDVLGIVELCEAVLRQARGSALRLNVTVSPFVPKPHTPFQWEPAAAIESIQAKVSAIRDAARNKRVRYKFHMPERCLVEALLARGDRRLGRVIRTVQQRGGQFDAWDEHFSLDLWMDALRDCGVRLDESDPNSPLRARGADEVLPWDHIDCGVSKEFLLQERERALRGEPTPDCREGPCSGCGACERAESAKPV